MDNHSELVASIKQALQQRGVALSGPDGAFAITQRVAWALRDEGAGLLSKTTGNNSGGYAADIVAYPNGVVVDILGDAGGANGPQWDVSREGEVDAARWRPPVDPGDSHGGGPAPVPTPDPGEAIDLRPLLAVLQDALLEGRAMRASLDALNEKLTKAVEGGIRVHL